MKKVRAMAEKTVNGMLKKGYRSTPFYQISRDNKLHIHPAAHMNYLT
ncbi:hypothetical protein LX69_03219 [Breznakibacter xylanolyticus]|uniref:Uncharacterized protein n=1 Tax=Breznakibacter xylanolyticus TaxID=990 RepID=A0A2W7PNR9_9BACT|nr:hypothetical protein LX69_03219 [Breznakibacter xylanolyticus]